VTSPGTASAAGCLACGPATFSLGGTATCTALPTGVQLPLQTLAPEQALLIAGARDGIHVLSSTEFGFGYACVGALGRTKAKRGGLRVRLFLLRLTPLPFSLLPSLCAAQ
jgi:hypothetical protein